MADFKRHVDSITDAVTRRALQALSEAATEASLPSMVDNSGGAAADGTVGVVTAPIALIHAFGTADNTIDDVGAAFAQATLNNNFKELSTVQAANRVAIVALADAVKELSTKVNAILTALR